MTEKIAQIVCDIEKDKVGDLDEIRLEHILRRLFASIVVVLEDVRCLPESFRDHRCWTEFDFNKEYSMYEYERWLGSCYDLARNHPRHSNLLCKFTGSEEEIVQTMSFFLPNLQFQFKERTILIKLENLCNK